MKLAFSRVTGIILVVTAVFGILFSFIAILQIWRSRPSLEQSLSNQLILFDSTVSATNDGLTVVGNSLETARGNVNSMHAAAQTLAHSIHDSTPMVDSIIRLVGTDLPQTITATQTSLASAQTSAQLIDDMLSAISQIPFLGLGRYKPDVPLNIALGQISTYLQTLQPSLSTLNTSLQTTKADMDIIEQQVTNMGEELRQINQNLTDAQAVLRDYQATTRHLQGQITQARSNLGAWLRSLSWLLTFLLVWLGIMQISLLVQGMELLGYNKRHNE